MMDRAIAKVTGQGNYAVRRITRPFLSPPVIYDRSQMVPYDVEWMFTGVNQFNVTSE